MTVSTPTLIIGASSSGLAVARQLEERGLDFVIVDKAEQVGTMWRGAYERLHLHTPRGRSGLPFVPMPRTYLQYPARQQVVNYLEAYAEELKHKPRMGVEVASATRENGKWVSRAGAETFVSDNLVIATGNTRVPLVPKLGGQERFAGTVIHSSKYRSGSVFMGKRVLVVGFGNSAAEIAIDLFEQGAVPTLSVRSPINVVPRDVMGIPIVNLAIVQTLFPAPIADAINRPVARLVLGNIERLGLKTRGYGPIEQIRAHGQTPVIDVGTIRLIRKGKIGVRPGLVRLTLTGAVFTDGREEDFDAVVLGTGYRAALDGLLKDVPGVLDDNGTPLVSGAPTKAPGLYFCGFKVVTGGALREAGRESARIADAIARG